MIETFLNIENNPSVLRVDFTQDRTTKMKLPPFVTVVREVTDDNAYQTWRMALNNYKMPETDIFAI